MIYGKIKCMMKERPCRESNPKRHHEWSERQPLCHKHTLEIEE